MTSMITAIEAMFGAIPRPVLDVWGLVAYAVGLVLAVSAFAGLTFRPGGRWGLGREQQAWDVRAVLSILLTFVLIIVSGYVGSFIVLVPGAQTFESLKDLVVFLAVVLFGYPALITVPFAYGLADLIEGVPPDFLLDWLPGYFINAAFFWIAYQFFGKDPDFRRARTWAWYGAFVVLFMALEPIVWGYICAGKFTAEISYHNITPALFFTTSITWMLGPVVMLAALPAARRAGLFWAEIPGHVSERAFGRRDPVWTAGGAGAEAAIAREGWPIRVVILAPFLLLALVMIGVTAYVTLRSAEDDAEKLATRLHQEISDNIRYRLDQYLAGADGAPVHPGVDALLRGAPIASHGLVLIVDRAGAIVASSSDGPDPVADEAVLRLRSTASAQADLQRGLQFTFDHVTEKPLARTTWLARATSYEDRRGRHGDWVVVTVMPEAFYLAGVEAGSRQSAMVFAVALVLFLAAAAALAAKVTGGLRRIAFATESLAHGRLDVRLPDSRLEEVGTLSRSFNDMASRLRRSIDDLRAEVETRTRREAELEASESRARSSEGRLQLALHAGNLATWEWDFTNNRLDWDDAMYELYGVARSEFPGTYEAWMARVMPEDAGRAAADATAAAESGRDLTTEFRLRMPDDSIRVVSGVGRMVAGADGRPARMVGISWDITDRRRMERLLETESHVLGMIVAGAGLDQTLSAIATSIEALAPDTLASVLLLDAEGRMRSGAAPSLPAAYQQAIEGAPMGPKAGSCGTAAYRREPVIVSDIETDPLWDDYRELARTHGLRACWSTPIVSSNGAVLGTFAMYYRKPHAPVASDRQLIERATRLASLAIERTRAAEALSANEARLRREKAFVDTLLDSLPGVVSLFDAKGRFRKWNKAVEQVTGYTGSDLASLTAFDLMDPADADAVAAAIARVQERGRDAVEARMLTRDGRSIPYYFQIVRLLTDEGWRTFSIGIDISERRTLEEQFRQAQKMEAVGHLSAGVAHDFNNLLTIISGYSQLLEADASESGFDREAIAAIRDAGDRAASLTRQLLAFSRKTVLQPKVVDVNIEVQQTEKMLRRVIGEDIQLTTSLDLSVGAIRVDPGQLGQALMNLAVNARDAMPRGGTLSVVTRPASVSAEAGRPTDGARPGGAYVVLAVSDTGTGMSPEVRARIFEPFFTTKGVGKGTGLGLAMIYGFVKQSGGYIEVQSAEGAGTTFELYFPVADTRAEAEEADAPQTPRARGTETVLLVEDDPGVRVLTTRALEREGYRLLVGVDGQDALRVAAEHTGPIDLVVTDVVMPGLGGRELATALRERHPGLRVLYVSGYTDDAVVRAGLLHDEIAFLSKPYDHPTLARKVRQVLDH